MRPGGGKAKGANFERETCVKLSLWVSRGKREDLFWRTAMSGGRATVRARQGVRLTSQAGDISAVHKMGHILTADFYFELKHVKSIGLDTFIVKGTGPLATYWKTACREARKYNKDPVLIVRQNRMPTLWIGRMAIVDTLHQNTARQPGRYRAMIYGKGMWECEVWLFDDVLQTQFAYAEPIDKD